MTTADALTAELQTVRFITFEPSSPDAGGVGGYEWDTANPERIDALYEEFTGARDMTDDNIALYEIEVPADFAPTAIEDLIQSAYLDDWPKIAPLKERPGTFAQKWVLVNDGAEQEFTNRHLATIAYEALMRTAPPQGAELLHVVFEEPLEGGSVARLIRTTGQPVITIAVPRDVAGAIGESLEYVRQETPDDSEAEDSWGKSAEEARTSRAGSREGMLGMIDEAKEAVAGALASSQRQAAKPPVGTRTWIPSTPVTRITTSEELEAAPYFSIFAIADEDGTLSVHKDPTGHYFISGTSGPHTAADVLIQANGGLYLVFTPPSQTLDWFNQR